METMTTSSVTENVTTETVNASVETVATPVVQTVAETSVAPVTEAIVENVAPAAAPTIEPVATTASATSTTQPDTAQASSTDSTSTSTDNTSASTTNKKDSVDDVIVNQPLDSNSVIIKTSVLQDLISRAVKGSSMVDVIPLSCLMRISIRDGKISVTTTDNVNYLTTFADGPVGKEFEVFVESKFFSQIISKLSTPQTTLSIVDGKLVVQANGKYNVSLHTETDGSAINLNVPEPQTTGTSYQLTREEIKSITTLSKSCKAEMKEIPCLFNYYFDAEKVLTSNSFKACQNPIKLTSTPICLSPAVVDLISSVQDDSGVAVSQDGDYVVFQSPNGILIGKKCVAAELDKFPANALTELFGTTVGEECGMNRTLFLNAIERICLFTESYQSNKLTITFGKDGVTLYSPSTESTEIVNYLTKPKDSSEVVTFDVDGKFLKEEIAACDCEALKIYFDTEAGLQIKCNEAKLMLSVLGEDEVA